MYNVVLTDKTGDMQCWVAKDSQFHDGFLILTHAKLDKNPQVFVSAAIKTDDIVCVLVTEILPADFDPQRKANNV